MKKMIIQFLKEVLHNCIIHPILPFIPRKFGNELHERNGKWTYLSGKE